RRQRERDRSVCLDARLRRAARRLSRFERRLTPDAVAAIEALRLVLLLPQPDARHVRLARDAAAACDTPLLVVVPRLHPAPQPRLPGTRMRGILDGRRLLDRATFGVERMVSAVRARHR